MKDLKTEISRLKDRNWQLSKQIKKLSRLAYGDTLTGCYNRNYLEEVKSTLKSTYKELAIVDIDGLKHINDTQGHAIGDKLIHGVAASLLDIGVVFRLGGDEFLVCGDGLNRLKSVPRISYGVVKISKDKTVSDLMKEADILMYEMKRTRK